MKHRLRQLAAVAVSACVSAAACEATRPSGSGGASTTTPSTASGATGGCGGTTEAFGACNAGEAPDGGSAEPGEPCQTDADCKPACCPCPHGQTQYAYASCACGRCASVCDPSNDYRAPVCLDGGGPIVVHCFSCAQILNDALADGDQLGPLACPGAATAQWSALGACVAASCGAVCPAGIMPTNDCVTCIEQSDGTGGDAGTGGGCGAEITGCTGD